MVYGLDTDDVLDDAHSFRTCGAHGNEAKWNTLLTIKLMHNLPNIYNKHHISEFHVHIEAVPFLVDDS